MIRPIGPIMQSNRACFDLFRSVSYTYILHESRKPRACTSDQAAKQTGGITTGSPVVHYAKLLVDSAKIQRSETERRNSSVVVACT